MAFRQSVPVSQSSSCIWIFISKFIQTFASNDVHVRLIAKLVSQIAQSVDLSVIFSLSPGRVASNLQTKELTNGQDLSSKSTAT